MDNKKLKPALAIALIALGFAIYLTTTGRVGEASIYSLLPPLVAIFVALFTKEVFSSLFLGILTGSILASKGSVGVFLNNLVYEGFIKSISQTSGIFIFLVVLGVMVVLINYSGGSKAFGNWANARIKTRKQSQIATFFLCIMLFIDDYFNCLTSGSVMKPITDSHKVSRAKLAYIIDATAAPVCMIAPISSWAAAVSGYAENSHMSGIELFVKAIPFNFYSLLTLVFVVCIISFNNDYGPMKKYEEEALAGKDQSVRKQATIDASHGHDEGRVMDLVFPILTLIVSSVLSLINVGGFFDKDGAYYHDFVNAFANTDSSIALAMGSIIALVITIIYFVAKKSLSFEKSMDAISEGFSSMVSAILILTMATSLKNISNDLLGSTQYVGGLMENAAGNLNAFLPVVIFVVAIFLAFATGTSWGTFGILIPIVVSMFEPTNPIFFIGISATLSGAVCGDHLSPISDTTIMSSTGAGCEHIDHVRSQLPYGMTVAIISALAYIIAGFTNSSGLALGFGVVVIFSLMYILKIKKKKSLA